jgi:hypothetical protein
MYNPYFIEPKSFIVYFRVEHVTRLTRSHATENPDVHAYVQSLSGLAYVPFEEFCCLLIGPFENFGPNASTGNCPDLSAAVDDAQFFACIPSHCTHSPAGKNRLVNSPVERETLEHNDGNEEHER